MENKPTSAEKTQLGFLKEAVRYLFDAIYMGSDVWNGHTTYFGIPIFQNPCDLWMFQELIFRTKPNIIIETGTAHGASALYLGTLFDNLARCTALDGKIISIDIEKRSGRQVIHPRVTYLTGSSVSDSILDTVHNSIKETDKVMVILDSDHSREHVNKELAAYHKLVSKDCYLIVCDTNLSSHAIPAMLNNKLAEIPPATLEHLKALDGYPMSAALDFVQTNKDFVIDKDCEKFGFTFNPNGFLRRIN